jgi:hypothetical protein
MVDFYPGSKKQKKSYEANEKLLPENEAQDFDLGKSKIFLVNGQPTELFTLGAVARALNRQPVTVRKWESEGIIPRSPFVLPSHDPRGQRRLYTRAQIEALRTVAEEEGVLSPNANGKWKAIETTSFREKAIRAFKGAQ